MNTNPLPQKIINEEALAQFAQQGRLYAVLDACDVPSVPSTAQEMPENRASCLYINQAEEDFSAFAPYLFSVDADLLEWARDMAAQEGGGIFAISDVDQEGLHKHFRRFLLVLDPNGEEMYFRFYDPRVLPKFLAACTEAERRDLFGPTLAFGVIKEGAITLLQEQPGPLPDTAPPRPPRVGLFQTRPEHLRAFAEEGERAFEIRLMEHLREYHGDRVKPFPEDTLVEMIRNGIARARGYQIVSEADLTAFVAIMFAIAPNFDRHPYIHDVLTDVRISSDQRIDALVKRVPDFVWEEAGRRYDVSAWGIAKRRAA